MSVQQGPLDLAALRGTVCVVTGAGNGGIGYGICEVAADLGLHIALVDLFQHIADGAAAKLLESVADVRVLGYACDVTQPESLQDLVNSVRRDFEGLRVGAVFANAGVSFMVGSFMEMKLKNIRQTMDVNVVGAILTLQAFVPVLRESTEPSVCCTTASVGGLGFAAGGGGLIDYCASKHAVVNLTESLAAELCKKDKQIRVHVCCPGVVKTGLLVTSHTAKSVDTEKAAELSLAENELLDDLTLTPRNHARQVWDRIAAGEFYMVCDNIRPYVDHDFPLASELVGHRAKLLLKPDFQRSFDENDTKLVRTSPFMREMARRMGANSKL